MDVIYVDVCFISFTLQEPDIYMGLGKKFERKKVRIAKKVELFSSRTFSSNFFLVHMEAEVLQQWQTTHFKACSK